MLKVGHNCCPSFTTEYREFQESPYGTREQVQGIPCPTSKPRSPKTKAHVCRKVSLFAKAWVSITSTKRNREAKGEGCQETLDQSQDNTRRTVPRKTKTKGLLHLHAERKGAQRRRQGHRPAGIPVPSEKQDSGSAKKKKFKETLDSITIFSSYGNNLSWHFIFSWTLASRRIKTGRALISWSFILLLVYCFS